MIDYMLIIKILLLSNFIVNFTPLQWIIELLPDNMIKWILVVITTCFRCNSFWLGLCITQNLYIAAGISFLAYIYTKIEERILAQKLPQKLN